MLDAPSITPVQARKLAARGRRRESALQRKKVPVANGFADREGSEDAKDGYNRLGRDRRVLGIGRLDLIG